MIPGSVAAHGGEDAERAGRIIRRRAGLRPRVHVVLGSGLGAVDEIVEAPVEIPFADLPGFPPPSVAGHAGRFLAGRVRGTPVLVQSGRFHLYEGVGAHVVGAPIRAGRTAGAGILALTNAAGGIRADLAPGSLMLVADHLVMPFRPKAHAVLAGPEARVPAGGAYDPGLTALAKRAAAEANVPLAQGVYGAVLGPQYETPAEVRALRAAGVDAVGMSTVPEVMAGLALGQRVLAVSVITNWAAGLGPGFLDHDEVAETGARAGPLLARLLAELIATLDGPDGPACKKSNKPAPAPGACAPAMAR